MPPTTKSPKKPDSKTVIEFAGPSIGGNVVVPSESDVTEVTGFP